MHVGGVDGMTPTDAILANLRRKERLYRADGCTATADDYAATVALIEGMRATVRDTVRANQELMVREQEARKLLTIWWPHTYGGIGARVRAWLGGAK
jgi:hypothetical protein